MAMERDTRRRRWRRHPPRDVLYTFCLGLAVLRWMVPIQGFSTTCPRSSALQSSSSSSSISSSSISHVHIFQQLHLVQRKSSSIFFEDEEEDSNDDEDQSFVLEKSNGLFARSNNNKKSTPPQRIEEPRQEQQRRRRSPTTVARRSEFEDSIYDDDEDEDDEYDQDDEDDDEDDEDDDEEEWSSSSVGNFWSNPTPGSSPSPRSVSSRKPTNTNVLQPSTKPSRRRLPLQDDDDDDDDYYDDDRSSSRSRNRQTTSRRRGQKSNQGISSSSMSLVPGAARDFYERLFWHGFDPSDTPQVGDRTVFGGTKGKFNGLAYLQASEDPRRRQPQQLVSRRRRRSLPPSNRADLLSDEDDEDDEDEDMEEDEDLNMDYAAARTADQFKTKRPTTTTTSRSDTPPEDRPRFPKAEERVMRDTSRRTRQSRTRQQSYRYDNDDDEEEGNWVSKQVSSWFSGIAESDDDDDDNDYVDDSRRRSRRSERRSSSSSSKGEGEWSPLNALETFLGLDRDEMAMKADMYNAKMGIGRSNPSSSRTSSPSSSSSVLSKRQQRRRARTEPNRRRPGYAYRYDVDEEDEDPSFVVDVEPVVTESANRRVEPVRRGVDDSDSEDDNDDMNKEESVGRQRELTWEERALAVERVPPADIPAWGPSGEIPNMDGRTKAILDALEDLQLARQKLERREKRVIFAKEEITILKVDAELQRRQLNEEFTVLSTSARRLGQERLRQIEIDLDVASRTLRRARSKVTWAKDELEELKIRHWAVLGYYDPKQAEEKVDEALQEFRLGESTNTNFMVPPPPTASSSISDEKWNMASTPKVREPVLVRDGQQQQVDPIRQTAVSESSTMEP